MWKFHLMWKRVNNLFILFLGNSCTTTNAPITRTTAPAADASGATRSAGGSSGGVVSPPGSRQSRHPKEEPHHLNHSRSSRATLTRCTVHHPATSPVLPRTAWRTGSRPCTGLRTKVVQGDSHHPHRVQCITHHQVSKTIITCRTVVVLPRWAHRVLSTGHPLRARSCHKQVARVTQGSHLQGSRLTLNRPLTLPGVQITRAILRLRRRRKPMDHPDPQVHHRDHPLDHHHHIRVLPTPCCNDNTQGRQPLQVSPLKDTCITRDHPHLRDRHHLNTEETDHPSLGSEGPHLPGISSESLRRDTITEVRRHPQTSVAHLHTTCRVDRLHLRRTSEGRLPHHQECNKDHHDRKGHGTRTKDHSLTNRLL